MKAMFDRLAGTDGEIDSEELQDMLTAHFAKSITMVPLFFIDVIFPLLMV